MNKFLIFAFVFALTNCYLKVSECNSSNSVNFPIYLDTSSKDYEYKVEFDWTDEPDFPFKVPLVTDANLSTANVIPFFINTSNYNTYDNQYYSSENTSGLEVLDDLATKKVYDKYSVFYPFDASISKDQISAKVKSTDIKANENDVTQKFMKYFGIAVCVGDNLVETKVFREILVIINNGNYFSTSKILLACLALLFL
jgi:hypothetical protein